MYHGERRNGGKVKVEVVGHNGANDEHDAVVGLFWFDRFLFYGSQYAFVRCLVQAFVVVLQCLSYTCGTSTKQAVEQCNLQVLLQRTNHVLVLRGGRWWEPETHAPAR